MRHCQATTGQNLSGLPAGKNETHSPTLINAMPSRTAPAPLYPRVTLEGRRQGHLQGRREN